MQFLEYQRARRARDASYEHRVPQTRSAMVIEPLCESDRDRARKRSQLMGAAETTTSFWTIKSRDRIQNEGFRIGGVRFSASNKIEAVRYPEFKWHKTVGRVPVLVAMGAHAVTVRFRGLGRNKTRKNFDSSNSEFSQTDLAVVWTVNSSWLLRMGLMCIVAPRGRWGRPARAAG